MRNFLLFFVFFILIITSCRKADEDLEAPIISVNTPLFNQSFNVGDTVFVHGLVTDNEQLKSIKISIYDKYKNVEIASSVNISNIGNRYILNNIITLNDFSIETDLYYLGITADDGVNNKKHFVPIHISGIERKMLGIIYLSCNGSGPTNIQIIDTLGVETTLLTLDGDYQTSEISSKYGMLFVAGALTGDFNAVQLDDKNVAWKIENQTNNVLPWFYNIYMKNSTIYVGTQNQSINAYSINGLPIRRYVCNSGWIPKQILEHESRLFAATENISYLKPQMAQFYTSSSLFINQQIMDFHPVKMFGKATDYLLMFANLGNIGKTYRYYFLGNAFNSYHEFGTDTIVDVAQINDSDYLVLTNQRVVRYNADQNSSITLISSFTDGKSLIYNTVGNQFFLVSSNQIFVYELSTGILKTTINTTKEIQKVHLYYNR